MYSLHPHSILTQGEGVLYYAVCARIREGGMPRWKAHCMYRWGAALGGSCGHHTGKDTRFPTVGEVHTPGCGHGPVVTRGCAVPHSGLVRQQYGHCGVVGHMGRGGGARTRSTPRGGPGEPCCHGCCAELEVRAPPLCPPDCGRGEHPGAALRRPLRGAERPRSRAGARPPRAVKRRRASGPRTREASLFRARGDIRETTAGGVRVARHALPGRVCTRAGGGRGRGVHNARWRWVHFEGLGGQKQLSFPGMFILTLNMNILYTILPGGRRRGTVCSTVEGHSKGRMFMRYTLTPVGARTRRGANGPPGSTHRRGRRRVPLPVC